MGTLPANMGICGGVFYNGLVDLQIVFDRDISLGNIGKSYEAGKSQRG